MAFVNGDCPVLNEPPVIRNSRGSSCLAVAAGYGSRELSRVAAIL